MENFYKTRDDEGENLLEQDGSRWFTVFGDVDDFIFYDNEFLDSNSNENSSAR